MLADGTTAPGFFNRAVDDRDFDLILRGAMPFASTDSSDGSATPVMMMKQALIDILQAAIKLHLADPGMDRVLSNGAGAIDTAMLAGHSNLIHNQRYCSSRKFI
jgi:hypothetical protein